MKRIPLLVGAAALAWPFAARATPEFPGVIQGHLGLGYLPSCQLCHVGTPTVGTATQPFAVSMKAHGLIPGNDTSLTQALDAEAADSTDSDGDGVGDIAELSSGTDPNGGGSTNGPTPQYGCEVGADGGAAMAGALGAAALLALALRRRRAVSSSR